MSSAQPSATLDNPVENGDRVVELLNDVRNYPERPRQVDQIETHISRVFLTDHFVYKLKKPVKFDFLDFSLPELRHAACQQEVQLNRRLAPDVYIGVVPITRARGRLRLGGVGEVVDWVVKMRRLPAEHSLDRLIQRQEISDAEVKQLASRLANFYQQLPPLTTRTDEYRQHIDGHIQANYAELSQPIHGLDVSMVRRAIHAQLRLLRLAPELIDNRVCDGRIVDGHGDLRPEHIYLLPDPVVIDCIEFNAEFRQIDVLDELAFLAMECDCLDAASMGDKIVDEYQRNSGDRAPALLLSFYKCYRACVRAKVVALREQQCQTKDRQKQLQFAQQYLTLADTYAAAMGPPLMVVVYGLPGSGKSTLAERIADSLGIELGSTDLIRRELFGQNPDQIEFNEEQYSPSNRREVYKEMLRRTGDVLINRRSVVLDGTFPKVDLRNEAATLAQRHGAKSIFVCCECPVEVARERIAARLEKGSSYSEARPEFYDMQQQAFENDPGNLPTLKVDTTISQPAILRSVFARLRTLLMPAAAIN